MQDSVLRENLINQAFKAYWDLCKNRDEIFKVVDFFIERYPPITEADNTRIGSLNEAAGFLRTLPYTLYGVIDCWKKHQPQILSKIGIELTVLNELAANFYILHQFFIVRDISLDDFMLTEVTRAYTDLIRCNRLLTTN